MKIAIFLLLITSHIIADQVKPSIEVIKSYSNTQEDWKLQKLYSVNQDKDLWIAIVDCSYDRGGCCSPITVLVDNKNGKAKELDEFAQSYELELYDINNDGISELVIESGFGRGGYYEGEKRLVQLTGMEFHTVYSSSFSDNSGACTSPLVTETIKWNFSNKNSQGEVILTETRSTKICAIDDECEPRDCQPKSENILIDLTSLETFITAQ